MERFFNCNKIVCEEHAEDIFSEEDDYMMIGFSDNGDDPEQYVIMQKAYFFDEQDIELGMDSYYMEYVSPQCEVVGYDICSDIKLMENEIQFYFKPNPQKVERLLIGLSKIEKKTLPSNFSGLFQRIIK